MSDFSAFLLYGAIALTAFILGGVAGFMLAVFGMIDVDGGA